MSNYLNFDRARSLDSRNPENQPFQKDSEPCTFCTGTGQDVYSECCGSQVSIQQLTTPLQHSTICTCCGKHCVVISEPCYECSGTGDNKPDEDGNWLSEMLWSTRPEKIN